MASIASERPAAQKPEANRPYTVWFDGIGALSYQKGQKQTVGFNPSTGVAILGFDTILNPKSWVGGGFAYSYTHIHEKKDAGHSHINQEYLFVYGSYQDSCCYFDGALWGGFFQIEQVRRIHMTGFEFKSTSHPSGGQLAPHAEFGWYAYKNSFVAIDPFLMVDWVSAWQGSFKEHGSGPFNCRQRHHYSSMIRSELGTRFYETFSFDAWRLTLEEKMSYVYKKPFHVGVVNAFLVGSPGSFTVETLTTPQNLGVAEFGMIFEPTDKRYPYGSITYQGEFGSASQSHQVRLELDWNF
jgi:outer membrane autotransporter protein